MRNSKLFQYIIIGLFIFFIIVGAILFSTYRTDSQSAQTINISIWGTLNAESFNSFVNSYFSDADLKYTVRYVEKNSATFDSDLVEALASGTGPDAIILPNDLIIRYANKIYTIPYAVLPEVNFKQNFIQEAELYLNSTGSIGLPFMVDPLVMYWNRDTFFSAGISTPPTTWSEVSKLTSKLTIKDESKNINRSTIALGEFRNINNAKEILAVLMMQAGGNLIKVGSDGFYSSTLNNNFGLPKSPALSALEFFTNFSNPARAEYSWNRSLPSSLNMFTNGDLAIYIGFASEYLTIKNKNPNLNFDVSILPQIDNSKVYKTYGNMLGFAILKSSSKPAGAYTVISALTSSSAFPFWKNIFNTSSTRSDLLGRVDTSAIKTIFNRSAIISRGWLDPNKTASNQIFQDMVESYTTGREGMNTAINTASDRLNNLLK